MKKLQNKLLVRFFTLIIVTMTVLAVLTVFITSKQFHKSLLERLSQSSRGIEIEIENSRQELFLSAKAISEDAGIKLAFKNKDRNLLLYLLEDLKRVIGADVVTGIDSNGIVLARGHNPAQYGDGFLESAAFLKTQKGEGVVDFVSGISGMGFMVSFPVIMEDEIIGHLNIGQLLEYTFINRLKGKYGLDIIVYDKKRLQATTFTNPQIVVNPDLRDLSSYMQTHNESVTKEIMLADKSYFVMAKPVFSNNKKLIGEYFLAISQEAIHRTVTMLTVIFCFITVLLLLASFFVCRRISVGITKPLKKLSMTALEVDKGNLSKKVDVISKDEVGIVAESFSKMTEGLNKTTTSIQNLEAEIEKRKQIEQKLRQSKEDYERLLNNLVESFLYRHDTSGTFIYASMSVENVLGYSPEEFMSHFSKYLTDDPVNKKVFERTAQSIKGIQQQPYEVQIYHKDGSKRWLEVADIPVRNTSGHVTSVEGIAHDITVRKQAEQALRESEEFAKASLNATYEMVYLVDTNGNILTVNDTAAKSIGKSPHELAGLNIFDFFPPDMARLRREQGDKVICSGKPVSFQDEREGRFFDISIYPTFDIEGKVDRLAIFVVDITERKLAHKVLTESQMSLAQAQRITHIGNWDWNIDQDNLFWSDEMFSIFGLDKEGFKISYDDFINVVHPDDRDFVNEHVQSALEGRALFDTEFRLLLKDGTLKNIEARGEVFRDENGKPMRMIGTNQDITERKKAEEALRDSEELLSNQFKVANIGLAVTSLDKGWIRVNKTLCEILGYSEEELKEKTWSEMTHPDDLESDIKQFEKILDGEIDIYNLDKRFIRKDGNNVYTHLSIGCVRNPDKTVNYLIASLEDITERMKAEEEKECLMDSLAEKTKEMENFTSIIRHDLGNPLLSVDAFATMLDEYCGQLDQILENNSVSQELRDQMSSIVKSDIPEAVSFIQTGAADMQKLLKGLKQVADVGRRTLQIEPQDMNEIIRQIVGKLNFQINDCGASIAVEPLSACLGDAIQLNQVFSNLLTNALKYLDPNRKGSIHVSSRVEQGMSIYCIEDNGIGISPANKEKVFEIFHRVDPEGHVSGEGLGLTIVGHIIEQHKGRIWLESELGKGSKFFVSLPTVYMADSTPKATESNSLTQSKENIKQF